MICFYKRIMSKIQKNKESRKKRKLINIYIYVCMYVYNW